MGKGGKGARGLDGKMEGREGKGEGELKEVRK